MSNEDEIIDLRNQLAEAKDSLDTQLELTMVLCEDLAELRTKYELLHKTFSSVV